MLSALVSVLVSLPGVQSFDSGLAALAQDRDRAVDGVVNYLKDRLKLTDDQAAKVREIIQKDEESRRAKIAELLDEDQKKRYQELQSSGGFQRRAGGFGGGGGGFGGGLQGMGRVQLDDLKRELELTEEQVEKVKPVVDEFNATLQKRVEELRNGGFQGLNIQEELQKFRDSITETGEKVKAHLTEAQKEKYDRLLERATGFMRVLPFLGGNRPGAATPAPRPSVDEKVRRAMDALKVEGAERDALRDLIAKVVRAQYELEDQAKAARERLTEAARNRELSEEALEDKLKEIREERKKKEKEHSNLQKELAEAVNHRQEMELIVQGILK